MQSAGGSHGGEEALLQTFLQRWPGEEGDGASTSCPGHAALIPCQLSSKPVEAYTPLEIDEVVSNIICKIEFPRGKLVDIPS